MPSRFFVTELDQPPDPRLLAMRIASQPGAIWLCSNSASPVAYLSCFPIESRDGFDPEPNLQLEPNAEPLASLPRWIGLLPYEAFRYLERRDAEQSPDLREVPLVTHPRWWRYGAIAVITDRVRVIGDDERSVQSLVECLSTVCRVPNRDQFELDPQTEPGEAHERRIRAALSSIAAGDVYQVNLARRFDFRVCGHALNWLRSLSLAAPAPFSFALEADGLRIAGTSPELCLSLSNDGRLLTCPIKGTRPRGHTHGQDRQIIENLASDPKEIAELSMVIDLERNDLSRISKIGSVVVESRGAIETYGPVHHRVAAVSSRLLPSVSRAQLLGAFLPSGSVTGAPKIRAMELIAELESKRRGLYTGAYGWIGHDGSMRLAMAIRTLVADETERGVYFAGGGIVANSIPQQEVEETEWKSLQILNNFHEKPTHWAQPGSAQSTLVQSWAFDS